MRTFSGFADVALPEVTVLVVPDCRPVMQHRHAVVSTCPVSRRTWRPVSVLYR